MKQRFLTLLGLLALLAPLSIQAQEEVKIGRQNITVKDGRMTPEEGAKVLAKPCYCGIFNQTRAAMLLEQEKEQTEK